MLLICWAAAAATITFTAVAVLPCYAVHSLSVHCRTPLALGVTSLRNASHPLDLRIPACQHTLLRYLSPQSCSFLGMVSFLIVLKCPMKRCCPAALHSPKLINGSLNEVLIMTHHEHASLE